MELTPELLGAGAVGVLVVAGAVGNYLQKLRSSPKVNPVQAGFSMGWFDSSQTIEMIGLWRRQAEAMERTARSLEIIADQRQTEMQDTLHDLVEHVKSLPGGRKRTP